MVGARFPSLVHMIANNGDSRMIHTGSIEPIQLEIDFDGTVLWNGTPVALEQLENYFRTEATKSPQPELHVRPNRRANYDVVAKVLALAQRNGMQRIGFVGNEQFME